jgi:hypothetical protein
MVTVPPSKRRTSWIRDPVFLKHFDDGRMHAWLRGNQSLTPEVHGLPGDLGISSGTDPVTPMDSDSLFKWLHAAGFFVGKLCVQCHCRRALFVVRGQYVGLCPGCVVDRIAALRNSGHTVPDWVVILDDEAQREVDFQREQEEQLLQVRWDDLCRCGRCGKVMHISDARYWLPPGTSSGAPYCKDCRAQLGSDGAVSG